MPGCCSGGGTGIESRAVLEPECPGETATGGNKLQAPRCAFCLLGR